MKTLQTVFHPFPPQATQPRASGYVCAHLGVPLATHKVEGPSLVLEFLGILLDTTAMEARLPEDKLLRLRSLVHEWIGKKSCTKRELLSLIGLLQHASKVVVPGRTFLRRLIDLSTMASELHHQIRLSHTARNDLLWWREFLASWRGHSRFLFPDWAPIPDFHVSSDAAGSLGCAAIVGMHWFCLHRPPHLAGEDITFKELFPIALAFHVWGPAWSRRRILLHCDNDVVVSILNAGTSKHRKVMFLLRRMFLLAASNSFTFCAVHVPGKQNAMADSLSRFRLQVFRLLHPSADPSLTIVPDALVTSLIPPVS